MVRRLTEHLGNLRPPVQFERRPAYSRSGDCIVFYFDEAESYAERLDGIVTVYRGIEDDRLIGCQIKGVSALVRKFGDFGIRMDDGRISLSMLVLVSNLEAEPADHMPDQRRDLYRELLRRAGGADIDERELVGA